MKFEVDPEEGKPKPRHFTQDPWWIVPLAGIVTAAIVAYRFNSLQRLMPGINLWTAIAMGGVLGMIAATLLTLRSYIRSPILSGCVLWGGIFLVALAVSVLAVLMM